MNGEDYTLEQLVGWFTGSQLAEMVQYLLSRPMVYRRGDGACVISKDRAWRDSVLAKKAQDEITPSVSVVGLAPEIVLIGVAGFEEQNIEIAAFVAMCQARWPCEFRDPDAQLLTPQSFLDQHRKRREDYRRKYF
jgi:hypothetical protein